MVERARPRRGERGRPGAKPRELVRELSLDAAEPASTCREAQAVRSTTPPTASRSPEGVRELLGDGVVRGRLQTLPDDAGRSGFGAPGVEEGSRVARAAAWRSTRSRSFHEWFRGRARGRRGRARVMTLATADADGQPSARMLLLKSADERGFTFFSGYESRKGRELTENPRAALVFYWRPLGRQVRSRGTGATALGGRVRRVLGNAAAALARGGGGASRQSEPIESRDELEAEFRAAACAGDEAAEPDRWGGYLLEPEAIELWQHRDDRLHERLRFTRAVRGEPSASH